MAITSTQVWSMAIAYQTALKDIPGKEKLKQASKQIGENFNKVLKLAIEVKPDIDAQLWPAPVGFSMANTTFCNYADIEVFINQILAHFHEEQGF